MAQQKTIFKHNLIQTLINIILRMKMANYFNTLNLREKLDQLGRCRFMDRSEFADGCNYLKGKKSLS